MALAVGGTLIASLLTGAFVGGGMGNSPTPLSTATAAPAVPGEYEQSLRAALAANPDDAVAAAALANLLSLREEVAAAIDLYERAVALEPDNAAVRLDFALALADAGNDADAELQYRRVLAVEPNNAEALYFLGELYAAWEPPRRQEAIAAWQAAVAAAPDSVSAAQAKERLRDSPGAAEP